MTSLPVHPESATTVAHPPNGPTPAVEHGVVERLQLALGSRCAGIVLAGAGAATDGDVAEHLQTNRDRQGRS